MPETPTQEGWLPSPAQTHPRSKYRCPPVHEVILSCTFVQPASQDKIALVPEALQEFLGDPRATLRQGFSVELGHGAQPEFRTAEPRFYAWAYHVPGANKWIARVSAEQIILNVVREGSWPMGPYVGWETVFDRASEVLSRLSICFSASRPRKASLRYVNRIALPNGSELRDWLNLAFNGPRILLEPFTFDLHQTWAELAGHPGLSAGLHLARIEVEDDRIPQDRIGLLLDIEIFNLLVAKAPSYAELGTWLERAHDAENELFEQLVTDRLRAEMDSQP